MSKSRHRIRRFDDGGSSDGGGGGSDSPAGDAVGADFGGDFFGDTTSNSDFFGDTTSTSGDFFGDTTNNSDFFGDTTGSPDVAGPDVAGPDLTADPNPTADPVGIDFTNTNPDVFNASETGFQTGFEDAFAGPQTASLDLSDRGNVDINDFSPDVMNVNDFMSPAPMESPGAVFGFGPDGWGAQASQMGFTGNTSGFTGMGLGGPDNSGLGLGGIGGFGPSAGFGPSGGIDAAMAGPGWGGGNFGGNFGGQQGGNFGPYSADNTSATFGGPSIGGLQGGPAGYGWGAGWGPANAGPASNLGVGNAVGAPGWATGDFGVQGIGGPTGTGLGPGSTGIGFAPGVAPADPGLMGPQFDAPAMTEALQAGREALPSVEATPAFDSRGPDDLGPMSLDDLNALQSHSPGFQAPTSDPFGPPDFSISPAPAPTAPAPDEQSNLGPNQGWANALAAALGPNQAHAAPAIDPATAHQAPTYAESIESAFQALQAQAPAPTSPNQTVQNAFTDLQSPNQTVAYAFDNLLSPAQTVQSAFQDLQSPNQTVQSAFQDLQSQTPAVDWANVFAAPSPPAATERGHEAINDPAYANPSAFAVDRGQELATAFNDPAGRDTLTQVDRDITAPPPAPNPNFDIAFNPAIYQSTPGALTPAGMVSQDFFALQEQADKSPPTYVQGAPDRAGELTAPEYASNQAPAQTAPALAPTQDVFAPNPNMNVDPSVFDPSGRTMTDIITAQELGRQAEANPTPGPNPNMNVDPSVFAPTGRDMTDIITAQELGRQAEANPTAQPDLQSVANPNPSNQEAKGDRATTNDPTTPASTTTTQQAPYGPNTTEPFSPANEPAYTTPTAEAPVTPAMTAIATGLATAAAYGNPDASFGEAVGVPALRALIAEGVPERTVRKLSTVPAVPLETALEQNNAGALAQVLAQAGLIPAEMTQLGGIFASILATLAAFQSRLPTLPTAPPTATPVLPQPFKRGGSVVKDKPKHHHELLAKKRTDLRQAFTSSYIRGFSLGQKLRAQKSLQQDQLAQGGLVDLPGRYLGGGSLSKWGRPHPHRGGARLIHSATPGRTDRIRTSARPGSFVIPADVVSGMGQGNTIAGAKVFGDIFSSYGPPKPMAMGHLAKPSTPSMPKMGAMNMPKLSPMHLGKPPSIGKGFADGGSYEDEEPTPIITAGGEMIVDPELVMAIGGGDAEAGHKALREMVPHLRKQVIAQLKQLPGPIA